MIIYVNNNTWKNETKMFVLNFPQGSCWNIWSCGRWGCSNCWRLERTAVFGAVVLWVYEQTSIIASLLVFVLWKFVLFV